MALEGSESKLFEEEADVVGLVALGSWVVVPTGRVIIILNMGERLTSPGRAV